MYNRPPLQPNQANRCRAYSGNGNANCMLYICIEQFSKFEMGEAGKMYLPCNNLAIFFKTFSIPTVEN